MNMPDGKTRIRSLAELITEMINSVPPCTKEDWLAEKADVMAKINDMYGYTTEEEITEALRCHLLEAFEEDWVHILQGSSVFNDETKD